MNKKPDYFRALQILALEAVEFQDSEAFYRKICRWYSKTFYTPLDTVEDLPVDKVLLTYYEETFDGLYHSSDEDSQHAYQEYRKSILTPDGELKSDDEEWALKEIEALKRKKNSGGKNKVTDAIQKTTKNIVDAAKEEFMRQQNKPAPNPNINTEESVDLDNFSMRADDAFIDE